MVLQASISLLFVLLLILPPFSTAYFSEYVLEDCYYAEGTFKKNSQYHQDLKLLLGNLSISTPATGFFKDKIYVNGTVEVAALAMCRGDLELPKNCSSCVEHAVSEIGNLCPYKKNASVFYDHCYLRYGHNDFIGEMEGTPLQAHSIENITKSDREKFYAVREKLLSELLVEATNGTSSPAFFATGEAKVSSDLSVFALLQCTPDLITKQCKICLKYQIDDVPDYAGFSAGFVSIGYGCFLRYENELFYNKPSQPPSPSPSPSPPPPPPSPPPSPPPETSDNNKENKITSEKIGMISGMAIMGLLIVAMGMGLLLLQRKRNKDKHSMINESQHKLRGVPFPVIKASGSDEGKKKDGEHLTFIFEDLNSATNYFSKENIIGEGDLGYVHKGILNEKEIAVKKMRDSNCNKEQFVKEVTLVAGLQHSNILRLLGYCIEKEEILLVYEYLSDMSLDKHLFDRDSAMGNLNWSARLNIIDGIVKGIQYLHEDCQPPICHNNLKPTNILLDKYMNPRIADFGISKFFAANRTEGIVTEHIGAKSGGYMAPEYRFLGKFSSKSDIYSLGVILLEILTGKRWSAHNKSSHNYNNLSSYISEEWKNSTLAEKLAKDVSELYTETQEKTITNILYIAMHCIEYDPDSRPNISDVRQYIKFSKNSSFKIPLSESGDQTDGKADYSNPLLSINMDSQKALTTERFIGEISNEGLR